MVVPFKIKKYLCLSVFICGQIFLKIAQANFDFDS